MYSELTSQTQWHIQNIMQKIAVEYVDWTRRNYDVSQWREINNFQQISWICFTLNEVLVTQFFNKNSLMSFIIIPNHITLQQTYNQQTITILLPIIPVAVSRSINGSLKVQPNAIRRTHFN
jgi:hypothetical protein